MQTGTKVQHVFYLELTGVVIPRGQGFPGTVRVKWLDGRTFHHLLRFIEPKTEGK